MDDRASLVRVSIFGQEYTVKAPADVNYIKDIASFVDGKMREVQDSLATDQSSIRIAILAAMNISDELFTLQKDKESTFGDIDNRVSSLIDLVDESLE
ncbi:MAG: cell division protein ZapA [Candidatus Marinimicrobia bacterium]|nr:cell division protein ZapA [Candidatus Neomarinimicrobiota bacterium]